MPDRTQHDAGSASPSDATTAGKVHRTAPGSNSSPLSRPATATEALSGAAAGFTARHVPGDVLVEFSEAAEQLGGSYTPSPHAVGAVGYTHFDGPGAEDNSLTVLIEKGNVDKLPGQALVRITSLDDAGNAERTYLGALVAGPFHHPDGLKTDSTILTGNIVQGIRTLMRYHGFAQVQLLGERIGGQLVPPRFRPKPGSPVHVLDAKETAAALNIDGNVRLGTIVGQDQIEVKVSTERKDVLPRHTGILGTTGSGKSTTVARYIHSLQHAGVATIVFDVEPEYVDIDRPTDNPKILAALEARGLAAQGTKGLVVYHPHGRATGREGAGGYVRPFCLPFSELSPYTVMDILDLNDPQRERFYAAFEATKHLLKELSVYPVKGNNEEETAALELDEFDRGYPRMTISHLIDVIDAVVDKLNNAPEPREPFHPNFKSDVAKAAIQRRVAAMNPKSVTSWLAVKGRLGLVNRLGVFDAKGATYLKYSALIKGGRVSVIDLGDTESSLVTNLLIASILRGVQRAQEEAVDAAKQAGERPTPVNVIVEEAHEFLSKERIANMQSLFEQVARIAKRGRKRWLGLTFVTQLPQHLPDEVLGLLNNFVLHKISDSTVVDRLRRSISGPDKAQWGLLPGLAPGQALISFSGMTRPLLTTIDPTPSYLRLTD